MSHAQATYYTSSDGKTYTTDGKYVLAGNQWEARTGSTNTSSSASQSQTSLGHVSGQNLTAAMLAPFGMTAPSHIVPPQTSGNENWRPTGQRAVPSIDVLPAVRAAKNGHPWMRAYVNSFDQVTGRTG
ncbi:hypothetical protein EJ05DRAFT_542613 [Pseudovirgaria hyperparasitica]|uniref:Uncharacterized protein n=1 Tax=Pseudovirgaria hyperparasitica TaxID=470096 RepID=A0A6A6VQP9_9PEZI|nr:uncharacterized protein EJ05DRAFT_542613 [Pseudovirgaria hyperparasitica]KAF2752455.1 hypothetical protein EJ05DRAFT_542613 [Pseudovirgaria hyperparasitica]